MPNPFYAIITASDGHIGCHLSASRGEGKPHAQRLIGDSRTFGSAPGGNILALLACLNVIGKTERPLVILTDNATTVQYLKGNRVPKIHEEMLGKLMAMVTNRGTTIQQVRIGTNNEMAYAKEYRAESAAAGKRIDRVFS